MRVYYAVLWDYKRILELLEKSYFGIWFWGGKEVIVGRKKFFYFLDNKGKII